MSTQERSWATYLSVAGAALLLAGVAAALLRRERKPRSFREDPIGAIKDRSGLLAGRAQDASDELLTRLQESLDELRGRLPDVNRRKLEKRRSHLNHRLADLNSQVQALVKDLRGNSLFHR